MTHVERRNAALAPEGRLLLLIEDDADSREAITHVLEESGYVVQSCESCAMGLRRLQEGLRPDLILLDLLMPDMTGWEFRVAQRRDATWGSIPTVALTACRSAEAQAIDADAYLMKPVTRQLLTETVEQLLAERDQAQVELHRRDRERLNSLGVLTAGIAHEVNNPLTFVMGNIDLARRELANARQHDETLDLVKLDAFLERAHDGTSRAAEVVRRIARFARPQQQERSEVDVRELVASSLQMVQSELRHRAAIASHFESAPPVRANAAELGLVFLNLLLNAAYALDGRGELGRVRVEVGTEDGQALVTIAHSGATMSGTNPRRFTDVMQRRGHGSFSVATNMSSSLRYLDELGAAFSVHVSEAHETVFRVLFKGDAPRSRPPSEAPRAHDADGKPLALVVDDEKLVCDLVAAYLEPRFEVTTTLSGEDALALIRAGASYEVIVCDVMMPGLTGIELYEALQAAESDQAERMVFISGGTFTERSRTFFERRGMSYVQKPFTATELLDAVKRRRAATGALPATLRA